MLAEQKKLDLDRDVNDYLQGMKIVNAKDITII